MELISIGKVIGTDGFKRELTNSRWGLLAVRMGWNVHLQRGLDSDYQWLGQVGNHRRGGQLLAQLPRRI